MLDMICFEQSNLPIKKIILFGVLNVLDKENLSFK